MGAGGVSPSITSGAGSSVTVSAPPMAMTPGALSFSSSTIRCASFGPTPGARRIAPASASAMARPVMPSIEYRLLISVVISKPLA